MSKTFPVLTVILMVAVIAQPAAALNVDAIYIAQFKEHWANVADSSPYGVEVWLTGTGITSVSVMDPHLVSHDLTQEGGEWVYELEGFNSITALDAAYGPGDYVFNFNRWGRYGYHQLPIHPTDGFCQHYPSNGRPDGRGVQSHLYLEFSRRLRRRLGNVGYRRPQWRWRGHL